jgi:hypothetical protein
MRRRKKKPAQVISIVLGLLMFGITGLIQFTGSSRNNASPDNLPSVSTSAYDILEDGLILNQTTSYRLQDGETLILPYLGKAGQVITMRLTSENGATPQIMILATIDNNAQTVIDVIPSLSYATEICGFIFANTGAYSFVFDAPVNSTYSVQFDSGDTCNQE